MSPATQNNVVNVVVAGLGGQGVLTCSDILAEAAFRSGVDVKKAEVHGMSQRGGSVACDVRFGSDVHSPMVPTGQADYLLVLSEDQVDVAKPALAETGKLLTPADIDADTLTNKRSLNVALLGRLSRDLDIDEPHWHDAIRTILPAKLHEANLQAFSVGRNEN
jgi:indolepyruvate ferredoxin oxidoreductase beta subunit